MKHNRLAITQHEVMTMNNDDRYLITEEQIQQLDTAMREYFELERRGNELLSQSIQETKALVENAIRLLGAK